jgi:ATP-dependent DNA ligase
MVNEIMLSKDKGRVKKLLEKYNITYVVYDIIEFAGADLRKKPYEYRRKTLERIFGSLTMMKFTLAETFENKQSNLDMLLEEGFE